MKAWARTLAAFGAGAALMYLLDPDSGRARRARLLQRRRDPRADMAPLARAAAQTDAELRARVQARLGRLVSHPRAIDVRVDEGVVRLSGAVLTQECEGLLAQLASMPGVHRIDSALHALERAALVVPD